MKLSFLVRKKQPASSAASDSKNLPTDSDTSVMEGETIADSLTNLTDRLTALQLGVQIPSTTPDAKNLPTNSDTYVIESEPIVDSFTNPTERVATLQLDIQKRLPEGDKIVAYDENGTWKSLTGEPLTINVPPADAKFNIRELGLIGTSVSPFTDAHLHLLTQEHFYESKNTHLATLKWQTPKEPPKTGEFKGHEIRYLIMPSSSLKEQVIALSLQTYLATYHYKVCIKPTRQTQRASVIVDLTASQQQQILLYPAGEVNFSFSVRPEYFGDDKMEQSCQHLAQVGSFLFEQIATTKIVYTRNPENQITHFDITWEGVRLMITPENMVQKMIRPPLNPIPQALILQDVNFNTSVKPPEPVQPSQTGLFATRNFKMMGTEHKKNEAGINSSTTINFGSHF